MRTLLFLTVFTAIAIIPAHAATIEIAPNPAAAGIGDTFTLDVLANDVTDMFSFQFDLSFDPVLLQASGVTEGPFLATGGAAFFIPGLIDNTAGTISFTADTLIGAIPGVSGSGTIASVEFQALAVGSSPISTGNILLLDSGFGTIDTTPVNGTVNISESSTVIPEPQSVVFLAVGLGALALLNYREQAKP
jgi:general secretion pathway protein D